MDDSLTVRLATAADRPGVVALRLVHSLDALRAALYAPVDATLLAHGLAAASQRSAAARGLRRGAGRGVLPLLGRTLAHARDGRAPGRARRRDGGRTEPEHLRLLGGADAGPPAHFQPRLRRPLPPRAGALQDLGIALQLARETATPMAMADLAAGLGASVGQPFRWIERLSGTEPRPGPVSRA